MRLPPEFTIADGTGARSATVTLKDGAAVVEMVIHVDGAALVSRMLAALLEDHLASIAAPDNGAKQ